MGTRQVFRTGSTETSPVTDRQELKGLQRTSAKEKQSLFSTCPPSRTNLTAGLPFSCLAN